MQTQGKLQNDHHQKYSTKLQQFHINIKYKMHTTNRVDDYLSWPPVVSLVTVFHSSSHEASEWPQLYKSDHDFATTYQMLGTCDIVIEFHIQYGILCHMGNICVPSREHEKLIWEAQ